MKVLTANRLADGEAVWYVAGHSWAETIEDAEIARDAASEERLERLGAMALANNEVVDVNLIDIRIADGGIVPVRLREQIRANGPTNRADLGKQARPAIARAA